MTNRKRSRPRAHPGAAPNPAPAAQAPPIDDAPPGDVLIDKVGKFTIIPNAFIEDARLSNAAVRLWIYLRKFGSGNQATTAAWPKYKTIRDELGWGSYVTIARALDELIAAGWITRRRRFSSSSYYTLNPSTPESGVMSPITPESGELLLQKVDNSSPESGEKQHQQKQDPQKPPPTRRPARAQGGGGADAGKNAPEPEPEHAETVMRELVTHGAARTQHAQRIAAKIAQHAPNLDAARAVIAATAKDVAAGKAKNPPGAMLTRLDAMTPDDWKAKTPRRVRVVDLDE